MKIIKRFIIGQLIREKKCVEFFVDSKFSYSQVIRAGLRHNIDWMLLSESRGAEVLDLMNSLSTGAYCMTTMHLDSVRSIPDRMYNMLGESNVTDRFVNSIYKYIDVRCRWLNVINMREDKLRRLLFYKIQ